MANFDTIIYTYLDIDGYISMRVVRQIPGATSGHHKSVHFILSPESWSDNSQAKVGYGGNFKPKTRTLPSFCQK
jgi:hypothetical protein